MKKQIILLCSLFISPTMLCMDQNVMTIHEAVSFGTIERVREILSENRNLVNARNEHQQTPLHLADDLEMAQLLVQQGADINAVDEDLQTPLHLAAFVGDTDLVQLFLNKGASVHARDNRGRTPLHYTAREDTEEDETETETIAVAEILLNCPGVQIDASDNLGETPLHKASTQGNRDLVQLLLDKGALVNVRDMRGETPLYKVSAQGDNNLTFLLLRHGANVNIKNNQGKSPFASAIEKNHPLVAHLLVDWPPYRLHRAKQLAAFLETKNYQGTIKLIDSLYNDIVEMVRKDNSYDTIQQIHTIAEQERREANMPQEQRVRDSRKHTLEENGENKPPKKNQKFDPDQEN